VKPLAFLDLETTGLDPARHEILEIAVVRADPFTLAEWGEVSIKVAPERLDDADPESLRVCGYSDAAWASALPLDEALSGIASLLDGAILAGHNVPFDKSFLVAGWKRTGLNPPPMDYHTLDTAALAWPLYAAGTIPSLSLGPLCHHLGIDRPSPHRALTDARAALDVARRLLPGLGLAVRCAALSGDERALTEMLLARLEHARIGHVGDGCDVPRDGLVAVLDALHHVATELVRRRHGREVSASVGPRIFVCGPFAEGEPGTAAELRGVCRALVDSGAAPIAPFASLAQFVDPKAEPDKARSLALALLGGADEVRVFGPVTDRMRREIAFARGVGVPVRFIEQAA
jgi:DNA polymerase-3 subunit epsilon